MNYSVDMFLCVVEYEKTTESERRDRRGEALLMVNFYTFFFLFSWLFPLVPETLMTCESGRPENKEKNIHIQADKKILSFSLSFFFTKDSNF